MHPTQTEVPQYNSRRERHDAEAAAKGQVIVGLTRRESRAIERADEYLAGLRHMNEGHVKNHELFPDAPIVGIVDQNGSNLFEAPNSDRPKHWLPINMTDDLEMHEKIIQDYQEKVNDKDWDVIGELDDQWHRAQPSEYESERKHAELGNEDLRRTNVTKFGNFVTRRIFGARQNWLNQQTIREKMRKYAEPEKQHGRRRARRDYTKAA